jgi:hypothetical protein
MHSTVVLRSRNVRVKSAILQKLSRLRYTRRTRSHAGVCNSTQLLLVHLIFIVLLQDYNAVFSTVKLDRTRNIKSPYANNFLVNSEARTFTILDIYIYFFLQNTLRGTGLLK